MRDPITGLMPAGSRGGTPTARLLRWTGSSAPTARRSVAWTMQSRWSGQGPAYPPVWACSTLEEPRWLRALAARGLQPRTPGRPLGSIAEPLTDELLTHLAAMPLAPVIAWGTGDDGGGLGIGLGGLLLATLFPFAP